MSCEVKTTAKIPELQKVQEWFGFSQDESWLNAVYYSASPVNDVIAFAHGSKIVILNANWQSGHQQSVFTVNWKGELENPNDIVTAILCIPLAGSSGSSAVYWTCIAVGLNTGQVLFYSDFGSLLFSQKWHSEPVQYIKAQSGKKINEEIYVGYVSCVCIIQGNQFVPSLKNLKNRNVGYNVSKASTSELNERITCRKWEYRSKGATVNDSVVVGGQKSCSYDHLLEQSLEGGFFAKCRSTPPQNSLVVGVGVKPYIGFYFAKEGFVQADFGDLAKAVANKLISSLPGWLTKSTTSQPQQESTQTIPSEPMVCRFGLCDIQRQAFNVWLAPGNQLAAVSDNLSRVVLVDCLRGIALRVWKGYRDAQCAFIKVSEKMAKSDRSERRKSLFLAIFSPRRSTLEIWALQHGPKVAAFNANKNGQLIYNTHSLMGVQLGSKTKYTSTSCMFLDPCDGTLKEITVPFHCALSYENSKAAKDLHLLRRMKMYMRGDNGKNGLTEIESITKDFQTNEIRLQCLEMLSRNKKTTPEIFKTVIDVLHEKNSVNEPTTSKDSDSSDHDRRLLSTYLYNYRKLVNFYIAIKQKCDEHSTEMNEEKLSLSESDLETIQTLLDIFIYEPTTQKNRVTFLDSGPDDDFTEFLSIFNLDTNNIYLNQSKGELYGTIGSKIFSRFLEKGHNPHIFTEAVINSGIKSDDFMKLVLNCWLEKPFLYTKSEEVIEDMTRLASVIHCICEYAEDQIEYEYNSICLWWQEVREILLESPCALRGLLSAIVCRNLSYRFRKREGSADENSSPEEDLWEQVSQEAAQWSLLIGKLDDISILGAVLGTPLVSTEPELPIISYEKPEFSLKSILNGGKGIVAELVAKWLTNSGINPKKIVENKNCSEAIDDSEITKDNLMDPVCKYIEILRAHFPFSLESGVLLTQMAWEYMCYWSKNLASLEYLKAGLDCLDAFVIEDFALKHGLCCMIWNAHLKIPLEAIKKLINKAGRVPKEKFCLQDVGIPDSMFAELLDYCLQFFKHFSSSLEYDKRELKFEEILQDGQIPLSFLTLQQNHAIRDILNIHIELCMVLHFIAVFYMKISKPIQLLFDDVANQTFFIEINREIKYTLPPANLILRKHREEFLCQAVSCSLDLVREDSEQLYIEEHNAFMSRIKELCSIWALDMDVLRKHEVVEMYAHGWDAYADELLERIVDKQDIGPKLLDIACHRLKIFAGNSTIIWANIAAAGSLLTSYLDNLASKTDGSNIHQNTEDINLESVMGISGKAFHILSQKDTKQLRVAGQLFDACHTIKELNLKR